MSSAFSSGAHEFDTCPTFASGQVTVTGTFRRRNFADECLKALGTVGIPARDISISGAGSGSKKLQSVPSRELYRGSQDKLMVVLGISGALIGAAIALGIMLPEPAWGFLKSVGVFATVSGGAVMGCMLGTLIGALVGSIVSESIGNVSSRRLPGNWTEVAVRLEKPSHCEEIRSLMADCGAAKIWVIVDTTRSP